jgi:hypothetical protein
LIEKLVLLKNKSLKIKYSRTFYEIVEATTADPNLLRLKFADEDIKIKNNAQRTVRKSLDKADLKAVRTVHGYKKIFCICKLSGSFEKLV